MLYLNQSYNYLIRKKRINQTNPTLYSSNDSSPDFYKQHKPVISRDEHYIPMKDLINEYGKSWLNLNIPRAYVNGKEPVISSKYTANIRQYIAQNRLNQFTIFNSIQEVYNGAIIQNDREAIKPYELDIYLPELNLAIEYNSIKYHSVKTVKNTYYHTKKSIRCRRAGIRLIHIYGFEDRDTQISLLQDLILGIDRYPKNDFNKNNLIGKIPKPTIIYQDKKFVIYGAGKLVS